jgi:hypothetical protein
MTPRKPVRAMKARASYQMRCGHYVLRGQLIVKRGGRWMCGQCAEADARAQAEADRYYGRTTTGGRQP